MSGTSLIFSPLIPWWAIAILGAAALALCIIGLMARASGTFPRIVMAAIILAILSGPVLNREERDPVKDVALLLVDESASQQIAGRLEETMAAADAMEERLNRYAENLEVRRISLRHDAVSDSTDGTLLMETARRALGDVPAQRYAGTVVITDGDVHDAARAELLPDGPLHALIVGDRNTKDRRLRVVDAPGFGLVGEPVTIKVVVEDRGVSEGGTVRLRMRRDDIAVPAPRVEIGAETTLEVIPHHRGENIIEIEVPALEGEISDANNRALIAINGVRDRLKVLLISGEPHPGERTWRNLLKSDPSVDLVHFTILRPPEKQDGTPIQELSLIAFPTRELFEVKLDEFDLIVFDRYRRRGVLPSVYLANVVDYVQEGGALLEAVGPDFAGPYSLYRTPLGELIPSRPSGRVFEEGFHPRISSIGSRHPVTTRLGDNARRAPSSNQEDTPDWGRWFRQIDVTAERGDTVMTGIGGAPLLILDRVGNGRVAQLTSDHVWLWARGFEGGGPHAELLRRLAHWLMREPELEEETLRARVVGDRLVVERRSVLPPETVPRAVDVEAPDGSTRTVSLEDSSPGLMTASLPVSMAGLYRLTDGERRSLATVGTLNPVELASFVPRADALAGPVDARGSKLSWISEDDLPKIRRSRPGGISSGPDWIGLRANGDYVVTGVSSQPLLPNWVQLLAAILMLAAIWRLETDR